MLRTKYLTRSLIFVVLSLVAAGLNYAYYPAIARFLSPADFGASQSLIAVLTQVGAIFSGLNLVTIYLVHRLDEAKAKQAIEVLQKVITAVFLLATALVMLGGSWLLNFLHMDNRLHLLIVAIDLLTSVPFIITFGYLVARKKFFAAGSLQVTVVGLKLLLGAVATARFGISGALAGIALGQVLGITAFGLLSREHEWQIISRRPWPTAAELKLIRPYAVSIFWIFLVNLLLALFISFDIIMARHYFTGDLGGVYAGTSTVSNTIVFVCLPLISVLLPHLDRRSLARSRGSLLRTSLMLLAACVGMTAIFATIPRQLLLIFGEEYTGLSHLLWRMGILMSLLAAISLSLQVGAFYAPARSGLIALLGLIAVTVGVTGNHADISQFISTITTVFVTILLVSITQVIWIYRNAKS